MVRFENALDDYLHQIVRTRPWTMKREEDLLTPFAEWLNEQPEARGALASATPEMSGRYSIQHLAQADRRDFQQALRNFLAWAQYNGALAQNPFERLMTA